MKKFFLNAGKVAAALLLALTAEAWPRLQAQLPFKVIDYSPAPGQFIDYTEYMAPNGVRTSRSASQKMDAGREACAPIGVRTSRSASPPKKRTQTGRSAHHSTTGVRTSRSAFQKRTRTGRSALPMEDVCDILNARMEEMPFSYFVSLGSFGGEITVKLNQPLLNGEGADFKVYGNAFYHPAHTPELTDRPGGSAEPGIVWVSRDLNGNGLPDDPWYEIAGSAYHDSATIHHYRITYYEPDSLSDDILWRDNQGRTGYIMRNSFHTQPSYYPLWVGRDSITFCGTRLADNAEWVSNSDGGGTWIFYCYDWGYADNLPNTSDLSNIDIDWAVDAAGEPVHLESIDFVKVVCALNQQISATGETSTEFAGVEPLRNTANERTPSAKGAGGDARTPSLHAWPNPCGDILYVECEGYLELLNPYGAKLYGARASRPATPRTIDLNNLPPGIYFLRSNQQVLKIIRK